jgi:LacI family transcriptional regulator
MVSRVSIGDIAKAAGVSKATVSQVLRNAGRISEETRRQVTETAKALGYVYNRAAANLRVGQSSTVGIGVTSIANPFFADFVSGATDVLEAAGYFPMTVNIEDSKARQQRFATSLHENMAAGAILCAVPGSTTPMMRDWRRSVPNSVMLLRRLPMSDFDFLGVDNREGMAAATSHLIELGHTEIGFLGGLPGSVSRAERVEGWRSTLLGAGLNAADELIEPCGATIAAGSHAVQRLLQRHPSMSAMVCHQDIVAFGATIGLRKSGIEPGQDISIVGFDDISMSGDWDPPLTTISVTPRHLGAEAARLLVRRISEPGAPLQSIFIRPKLIVRSSTSRHRLIQGSHHAPVESNPSEH